MSLTKAIQRVKFLQTIWKQIQKLFAGVRSVPPIIKLGVLALVVVVVAYVIYDNSGDWKNVAFFLAVVAFVAVGLWLVERVVRNRQRRMDADFVEEFSGTEMLEELRGQWLRAVKELDTTGVDRYNMSFYMLIGEPQSGKTTTLTKSGLNFPIGIEKIKGIGGTRNLDWWFTDEAVILDTAGRLTFQDEEATDEEEWREFLKLLQRYRPKCPVNGVIITIPCTSLLKDDAETREHKAQVLRKALIEIERNLEIQFPVYVLVTKADRIGGFAEFFAPLRAMEQTQLLGWSRPKERFSQPFSADEVREAVRDIVARMRRWRVLLLDQLSEEMTQEERDCLYPFPEELALIEQPLTAYLETVFPESRLLDPLFFRGFYITSGVQRGVPVLDACARILGGGEFGERILKRATLNAERAYFIRDFYRKKVFAERGLIVPTKARVRKVMLVKRVGYTAAAAVALLGTGWIAYRLQTIKGQVATPAQQIKSLSAALNDEAGVRPARVLQTFEAIAGVSNSNVEAPQAGRLAAPLPAIVAGHGLEAGWVFRAAGVDEGDLRRDLFQALRTGLAYGIVQPLLGSYAKRLALLVAENTEGALFGRLEQGRAGLTEVLAMLVDDDRARVAEAGSYSPPEDLDTYFEIAFSDETKDVSPQVKKAKDAYSLLVELNKVSGGEWAVGDPKAGADGRAGFALTAPWRSADKESSDDVVRFIREAHSRIEDALRAPDGAHRWIAKEWYEFDGQGDPSGRNTAKTEFAFALSDVADIQHRRRAVAYGLLRTAWLEGQLRTELSRLTVAQTGLGQLWDSEGSLAQRALNRENQALQIDTWRQAHDRFMTARRELMELYGLLQNVSDSQQDAYAALVAPYNEWFQAARDVAGEVQNRVRFKSLLDQLGSVDDSAWIVLSKSGGQHDWIKWAETCLGANEPGETFNCVHFVTPSEQIQGRLEVQTVLESVANELDSTRAALDEVTGLGESESWIAASLPQRQDSTSDLSASLTEAVSAWRSGGSNAPTKTPLLLHVDDAKKRWALAVPLALEPTVVKGLREFRVKWLSWAVDRELALIARSWSDLELQGRLDPAVSRITRAPLAGDIIFNKKFERPAFDAAVGFSNALVDEAPPGLAKDDLVKAVGHELHRYFEAWLGYWSQQGVPLLEYEANWPGTSVSDLRQLESRVLAPVPAGREWASWVAEYRRLHFNSLVGEGELRPLPEPVEALKGAREYLAAIRSSFEAVRQRGLREDLDEKLQELVQVVRNGQFDVVESKSGEHWTKHVQDPAWRSRFEKLLQYFQGSPADDFPPEGRKLLPVDCLLQRLAVETQRRAKDAIARQSLQDYRTIMSTLETSGLVSTTANSDAPLIGTLSGLERVLGKDGLVDRYLMDFGQSGAAILSYVPPADVQLKKPAGDPPAPFVGTSHVDGAMEFALSRVLDLSDYYKRFYSDSPFNVKVALNLSESTAVTKDISLFTVAVSLDPRGWSTPALAKHFSQASGEDSQELPLNRSSPAFLMQCSLRGVDQHTPHPDFELQTRRWTPPGEVPTPAERESASSVISFKGDLAFLMTLHELHRPGTHEVKYDHEAQVGAKERLTKITVPIAILSRKSDGRRREPGTLEVHFTLDGLFLSRLPIYAPDLNSD